MQRNWSIHNRPEGHGNTCPAPSYLLLLPDSKHAGAKPKFSLQSNNLTAVGVSECCCSARIEKTEFLCTPTRCKAAQRRGSWKKERKARNTMHETSGKRSIKITRAAAHPLLTLEALMAAVKEHQGKLTRCCCASA